MVGVPFMLVEMPHDAIIAHVSIILGHHSTNIYVAANAIRWKTRQFSLFWTPHEFAGVCIWSHAKFRIWFISMHARWSLVFRWPYIHMSHTTHIRCVSYTHRFWIDFDSQWRVHVFAMHLRSCTFAPFFRRMKHCSYDLCVCVFLALTRHGLGPRKKT